MEATDTRYDPINALWSSLTRPAISRLEAERAARRIYRHFGTVALGGPLMTRAAHFSGTVRRCWITPRVNDGLDKGWPRLVHDVSHRIFARRHPNFRPHAGGHAVLEREITEYVIEQGWLTGKLKPAAPRKATPQERRDKRLAQTEAAIARWEASAVERTTRSRSFAVGTGRNYDSRRWMPRCRTAHEKLSRRSAAARLLRTLPVFRDWQ